MCEQCVADTKNYCEPIPGWLLVRAQKDGNYMKKDDWGLVECNDPTFLFKTTPWIDPVHNWTDDQINALQSDDPQYILMDKWLDDMCQFQDELNKCNAGIDAGWRLIEACKKAGYDPSNDGSCANWLFHHLGGLINA